jgi:hypothetical protein
MRQGPLWIVEPPLSTGERMSVNDPNRPVALANSRRSRAATRHRIFHHQCKTDPLVSPRIVPTNCGHRRTN